MLPTPRAERLVSAVDHAEAEAARVGRALSDTATGLETVARRLAGTGAGERAAAGAGAGAGGWAGLAGAEARRRVEDARSGVATLSGHGLFLADLLRVEGSWLARALLAGGDSDEVRDTDRALTLRLREAADALAGHVDPATVPCLDLTGSTDDDPRAVADLWHSLDPAERQRLARDHPELGSVAGLSSATRDALNRTRLARLLDAGAAQELESLAAHLDEDPRRHLLSLVPGGDGAAARAVVAGADPDGASRVVTLIPGTGSSLSDFGRTAARAEAMCEVSDGDGGAEPCVAVSWQGYDAPPDLVEAGFSTERATGHAADLRTFAAGLDAVDRQDGADAPHSVVGYSYGSAVLGAAASDPQGLAADRMLHVGSGGATVDSIDEQWVDEGGHARPAEPHDVVGVTSRWDPVPWWSITGALGGLPGSADFGGIAVDVTEPGDGARSVPGVHSRYFDPGTVSLEEIGRLVADADAG